MTSVTGATDRSAGPILLVDDDPHDRLLTRDAFEQSRLANPLYTAEDGEEALDYLRRRGRYAEPGAAPRPALVLLDLNLPRRDGREVLDEIRSDPDLQDIPVVILTTSKAHEDVLRSYRNGANSYIAKPVTFDRLVTIVAELGRYWFEIVALPPQDDSDRGSA